MSEVIQRCAEEVQQIADSKGLVCIFPLDDEILIDWDDPRPFFDQDKTAVVMAQNGWELSHMLETTSVNGNSHYYFRINRYPSMLERITIQACLGSDPVREILSLIRLSQGSDAPTALFETLEMAERVNHWRSELKYT